MQPAMTISRFWSTENVPSDSGQLWLLTFQFARRHTVTKLLHFQRYCDGSFDRVHSSMVLPPECAALNTRGLGTWGEIRAIIKLLARIPVQYIVDITCLSASLDKIDDFWRKSFIVLEASWGSWRLSVFGSFKLVWRSLRLTAMSPTALTSSCILSVRFNSSRLSPIFANQISLVLYSVQFPKRAHHLPILMLPHSDKSILPVLREPWAIWRSLWTWTKPSRTYNMQVNIMSSHVEGVQKYLFAHHCYIWLIEAHIWATTKLC